MRTRHDVDGKPKYTNALARETSPYLLQHANNPVDWRAWNPASLAEAKKRDVPIFLSIGYSTCHWCHVMEEESFEDEEIARAINESFVAIKVDREERPDIDGIYMTAVQALTGHGGWPMTVFLTPEGKPFFAGTYFPARDGERGANLGFLSIVRRLAEAWRNERARVAGSADEIAGELAQLMRSPAPTDLPPLSVVDRAVEFFGARYDETWGGLSPAPKFPSSLPIRVLLRHHARTGDDRSLDMAASSFAKMADGGLYDQVGGGFHRYSTDERWLVPHFEKMLYDNALLVMAGLELAQALPDGSGRDRVIWVVKDVLRYVERDMTSPNGAFYSATDADSLSPDGKREEGWYFTWTPTELEAELGKERAAICAKAWGVVARGNFEGRSILWRPRPHEITADVERVLEEAREILYRARNERPKPLRDDKILAAWNGLMISAFARAAFVLDEPRYAAVAARAARFVLDHLRSGDGRLLRTWKDAPPSSAPPSSASPSSAPPSSAPPSSAPPSSAPPSSAPPSSAPPSSASSSTGAARHAGTLDDHAFLIQALLDVAEAGGGAGLDAMNVLDEARALEAALNAHFADESRGGFYLSADDAEALIAREKPAHDGAEPSGNSVHALNLARMAVIFDDASLRARAERTVCAFGQVLGRHPGAMSEMLLAVELLRAVPKEIVVVARDSLADARAVLAPVRRAFLANRVVVQALERDAANTALTKDRVAVDGAPTVYVCEQRACKLPAKTADEVARALS